MLQQNTENIQVATTKTEWNEILKKNYICHNFIRSLKTISGKSCTVMVLKHET